MGEQRSSLIRKLCEVMAAVGHVPKRGRNEFHKYDYAMEADIVEAVRGELAKRHVMLIPSVQSQSVREVTTKSGGVEFIVDIDVLFTFVDGESGETHAFTMPGCGQDRGDKALFKAVTGAMKYALLKTFLIPTGDDPEAETTEGQREGAQATRPQAQQQTRPTAKPQAQRPANPPAAPAATPALAPPAPAVPPESRRQNPEAIIGKAEVATLLSIVAEKKWANAAAIGVLQRHGYATKEAVKVKDYGVICAELERGPAPFESGNTPSSAPPTPDELRQRIDNMVGEMAEWDSEVAAGILESLTAFTRSDGAQAAGVRTTAALSDKRVPPSYGKVKTEYQAWQAKQEEAAAGSETAFDRPPYTT